MSKEIVSNGSDYVVEWLDRDFGGSRRDVIRVSGSNGSALMGNLAVSAAGLLTLTAPTMSTPAVTGLMTTTGKIRASATANVIADPGNAGAIAVTDSGVCNLTSAGAETRTLAIPTFVGQRLTLCMDVDGGDVVVTVASAYNQAANTIITLNDAGDTINLVGCHIAGVRRWRLVNNDGCTLS